MDVAGAIPLRLVRVRDSESPGAGAVWTLLTRMRRDMEIVLRARRHGACPVVPVYTVRCATVPVLCLCLCLPPMPVPVPVPLPASQFCFHGSTLSRRHVMTWLVID